MTRPDASQWVLRRCPPPPPLRSRFCSLNARCPLPVPRVGLSAHHRHSSAGPRLPRGLRASLRAPPSRPHGTLPSMRATTVTLGAQRLGTAGRSLLAPPPLLPAVAAAPPPPLSACPPARQPLLGGEWGVVAVLDGASVHAAQFPRRACCSMRPARCPPPPSLSHPSAGAAPRRLRPAASPAPSAPATPPAGPSGSKRPGSNGAGDPELDLLFLLYMLVMVLLCFWVPWLSYIWYFAMAGMVTMFLW